MEHEICIMHVEVCDAFRIKAEDWGSYEGKGEFNLVLAGFAWWRLYVSCQLYLIKKDWL